LAEKVSKFGSVVDDEAIFGSGYHKRVKRVRERIRKKRERD